MVDLVGLQVEHGFQVTVASPAHGRLAMEVRVHGAHHHGWHAVREVRGSVLRETRDLREILLLTQPDIVHLHSSKAGLAGRLAVRGRLPTVFQPHGWSFNAMTGRSATAALLWERAAVKWAHTIICVSCGEHDEGKKRGVDGPCRIVPNGVDVARFPLPGSAAQASARSRLQLPEGPTALFVGRIQHLKGLDVLLDAWPAVLSEMPSAVLVVVGDGPDAGRLSARAVPRVLFVGHQDDVRPWMAAADVVVVPSRTEGLPLVLLEAMAAARSVVVTSVGGNVETLRGQAGCAVPPEDHEALAVALVRRLADDSLRRQEGALGRGIVEGHHSLKTVERSVAAVYADLLATEAAIPSGSRGRA